MEALSALAIVVASFFTSVRVMRQRSIVSRTRKKDITESATLVVTP